MTARCRIALFAACLAWLVPAPARATRFQYVVAHDGKTSAGVFGPDGTLVRTLWSGAATAAGRHEADWDGSDDAGKVAPGGRYQIRVLSSRATYTWEGVVGNTSDAWSGPSVFHFESTVSGMAVTAGTAFIAAGYNEADTSQAHFAVAASGKKTPVLGKGAEFWKVATDGARVYWAGDDPNGERNGFVMATAVAGDAQVAFDPRFGQRFPTLYGAAYPSAVDIVRGPGTPPTGLAVQRRRPYLFVAHAGMNALHVLDKASGRLVRSWPFQAPGDLTVDANDDLWLVHTVRGTRVVQRMAVAPDGSLQPGATLSGLDDPRALAGGALVLVADAGRSQQIKAFTLAGAPAWTLGQAGGYARDPEVRDDRFDFAPDLEGTRGGAFLALEADGSFWVGDTGCYRLLRFSPARAVVDRVSYVPCFYSAAADPVAPSRVFANFLEFAVDYKLPLGPRNGSWRLVRNWRLGAPSGFGTQYSRMKYATTLRNGRTYACLGRHLFELPARGPLRDTGADLPGPGGSLYADGSVRAVSLSGETETWTEYPLAGFDADGNPRWGPPRILARVGLGPADPHDGGEENVLRAGTRTSGGVLISYDFMIPRGESTLHGGWHLGGVRVGGDRWLWRASRSTPRKYEGVWPDDGTFNIRNGVGNAGGAVLATGRHVFYGYRGEGWHGQEANKYRHYLEDGLLVGEFGVVYEDTHHVEAAAEMAGNDFSAWLVTLSDGRVYLYHNDESYHGGVHRWRLDGLDTVVEQKIDVVWKAPRRPAPAPARRPDERARTWDLLAGLPADADITEDQHGWTLSPPPDEGWSVGTNRQTWQTDPPVDLGARFTKKTPGARATLARDLPVGPRPLERWELRTRIDYADNYINHGAAGGQYLEVVDGADKVIARFYPVMITYPTDARIYGNDRVIKQARLPEIGDEVMGRWQPLRIRADDRGITFDYAGLPPVTTKIFDATADWRHPRRLRLTFWYAGEPYRRTCHLDDLVFSAEP